MGTDIILTDNQQTMTSLDVAMITGKQHKHVMEAIRKMESAWEKVHGSKFRLSSILRNLPNGGSRQTPIYILTKTECLYIATKFKDEPRAKLVLRWEQLETKERTTTTLPDFSNPAEAARAWAEQYELRQIATKRADEAEQQVFALSAEIESAQPKITYFEAFMKSVHGSKASCIREVVKQAHIKSETEFIAWMLRKRILFRSGKGNRLQPYAEYTSYFDIIDVYDAKNDWSGKQLKMNPYGKNKVVKRYHDEHPEAFYEQKQLFNI